MSKNYNVVTRYNATPDLVRSEKGYTLLIKIAIRIIAKQVVVNKKMTDV